jgi:hypothetical protein
MARSDGARSLLRISTWRYFNSASPVYSVEAAAANAEAKAARMEDLPEPDVPRSAITEASASRRPRPPRQLAYGRRPDGNLPAVDF